MPNVPSVNRESLGCNKAMSQGNQKNHTEKACPKWKEWKANQEKEIQIVLLRERAVVAASNKELMQETVSFYATLTCTKDYEKDQGRE